MKFIIFMSVFFLFVTNSVGASGTHAEYLGYYADQTYGNGEMEGYGVDLYKQGSIVFGSFNDGGGESISSNRLYDIKLNQSTGDLSFKAKLYGGQTCQNMNCSKTLAVHSIFVFTGHINHKSIIGKLRIIDDYKPSDKGEVHLIKLKRDDIPNSYVYKNIDDFLTKSPPDNTNGWGNAN